MGVGDAETGRPRCESRQCNQRAELMHDEKGGKETGIVAIALPCLGGANLDFPEDSTAYSRRGANWMWEVLGMWDTPDKDAEFVRWVDGVMAAMTPLSLRNGYVNLSCDQGPEWLRNLYGSRDKWARICALKKAFDPHNRLRYNKNVARAALLQAPASSSWVPSWVRPSWMASVVWALVFLVVCRVGVYVQPNWGLALYLVRRLGSSNSAAA
ncbi:hypothetical protein H634G_02628 [Metarhizium anisopliae BRIP 53293]|uniref:Berberine/berberine-like domain-containing protein n=1 Tax=Metarhizium anisopliae BRIP 53293 TaxID=1291518 RepID=A0A0D9P886_METAN|nr:hypothetical protein H634G_02628 [Metarhizium anisopliae BRIP 53293]